MTTVRSATASFFDRVLLWADVRVPAPGALLRAHLLMDFRGQQIGRARATCPEAMITALFWVVGEYLLLGGVERSCPGPQCDWNGAACWPSEVKGRPGGWTVARLRGYTGFCNNQRGRS